MAIKITMENSEIGGNATLLKNADTSEEIDIKISNMKFHHELDLLSSTEMNTLMSKISDAIPKMDPASPEYSELIKIINKNTRGTTVDKICDHIASFATGTLANVVSAYLLSLR